MTSEQERKHIEKTLSTKSVCLNEGTFMLRVSKNNVEYNDIQKQCLFGDSIKSFYSHNVSLIPTGIFLPQMFAGKNVLMEKQNIRHMQSSICGQFSTVCISHSRENQAADS